MDVPNQPAYLGGKMLVNCSRCGASQQMSPDLDKILMYENDVLDCLAHYCNNCRGMSIMFEVFSNFYISQIEDHCQIIICDTVDPVIQQQFDERLEGWLTSGEKRLIDMYRAYLYQLTEIADKIGKSIKAPDVKDE